MTKRIIKRTFEIPSHTDFTTAIAKVLQELPKTAPDTVIVKDSNKVEFDVRYIRPMLWQHISMRLAEVGAKEVAQKVI
jgi:hypothetical protein